MPGPPKPLVVGHGSTLTPTPPQFTGAAQMPVAANTQLITVPGNTPAPARAVAVQGAPLSMEAITQVGVRSQASVSDISRKLTENVKTSQMDELGKLMGDTMLAVKGYDPANTKGKLFGLIKRKIEQVRVGYESAENTVTRLMAQLDQRLALHQQRDQLILQMIDANRQAHHDLGLEIADLTAKLDWMDANVPVVQDPTNVMEAQKVQEWNTVVTMGRKHVNDLVRSRAVSEQFEAQLQMFKTNGILLTQKLSSFKSVTLPVLRQAFANYILMMEQETTAKMSQSVDDLTDNALKANAAKLGTTTVAVHTALNRSNISLDAIQANYTATVQALDDIDRLRSEMKARIASETPQIEAASRDLAARMARPAP